MARYAVFSIACGLISSLECVYNSGGYKLLAFFCSDYHCTVNGVEKSSMLLFSWVVHASIFVKKHFLGE